MDARLKAANVILIRGVRFRLPAPFWTRWLKKDWVTISHLKAGTIFEIARVVVAEGLEDVAGLSDHEFLIKSIPACARCIAIAVLNDNALGTNRQHGRQVDRLPQSRQSPSRLRRGMLGGWKPERVCYS